VTLLTSVSATLTPDEPFAATVDAAHLTFKRQRNGIYHD